MHPGVLTSRTGAATPSSPGQSTLPPFLLGGATQSPPSRGSFGGGFGSQNLTGSPYKNPVSQRRQQSPGSPKNNRKEVASTAPPVDGLFDTSAGAPALHAQDFGNHGMRAGDPRLGASPVVFPEGPGSVQKFSHHMGHPSPLVGGAGGVVPVTPFAGTVGSQHTGTPGSIRQQMHPPSRLADTRAPVDSPLTGFAGDMSGEITEHCWITVFGFPADAAPYMLQEFAHNGTIIKHSMDVNTNWMHICYQSPLQAKKALSKHGKIFMSAIMVGVMPCSDYSVMQLDVAQQADSGPGAGFASPVTANTSTPTQLQQHHQQQRPRVGTPSGMRPLTSTYQTPHNGPTPMQGSDTSTPQKSDGVIGKAMEYMFGW